MPTLITYVGRRPEYRDGLYGTGDWKQGETKPVHDATATKMLRHPDQYEKAEARDKKKAAVATDVVGEPVTKKPEDDEENKAQEARDVVAHMDKAALLDFAKVNFGQDLDKRLGAESLRAKVGQLIDQYGVA